MASRSSPDPGPDQRTAFATGSHAWEVLAALASVLVFARAVGFGWVYDDHVEVVGNRFITSLAYLPQWFNSTVWTGAGQETFLYRPLALLSYAVNFRVSGLEPWSYHAFNVLLHALAAVMVVRLARTWGLPSVGAGVAGLLFAVHPLHVEAVVAVFGRKDLLATAFVLGMSLSHRFALTRFRGRWRYFVPPLLFSGAMLSKEVGIVGVALVVAQDIWLEDDRRAFFRRREVPLLYASYLAVAALYLLIRAHATGGLGIPDTSPLDNPLVAAPLFSRVATAWIVVWKGVGMVLLPRSQSPDYSFNAIPLVTTLGDPRLLLSLGAAALAGVALMRTGAMRGRVGLGLAWYALALLPSANLLVLSGTIFAERLLYLPSVAACILAGALASWGIRHRRTPALAAAGIVLVGMTVQAVRYSSVWSDDLALFTAATKTVPRSTKAHHRLGEERLRHGDLGGALRSLHRALEIAPDNTYAAATLGQARQRVAERYADPERHPGEWPEDPAVLYALGAVLVQGGDTVRALDALSHAVDIQPDLARGWLTLASIHFEQGTLESAAEALRRFLRSAGTRYPSEQEQARRALARLESAAPS